MPRTLPRLTLSIALLACVGAASAQTGQTGQTSPTGPATTAGQPQTERIEPESGTPATGTQPRRGTQIREKRDNSGQVTEVEVQSGKSRYTLRPNQPAGNAVPGDAQSSAFRAPQWQVMEFDLNGKKKAAADAEAAAAAAGTTPPPGSVTASSIGANGAQKTKVPAATVPMTKPADIPPPPPLPPQTSTR